MVGGNGQSIGSTVFDAIVLSWLWSTATVSCFRHFSFLVSVSLLLVVDNWPHSHTVVVDSPLAAPGYRRQRLSRHVYSANVRGATAMSLLPLRVCKGTTWYVMVKGRVRENRTVDGTTEISKRVINAKGYRDKVLKRAEVHHILVSARLTKPVLPVWCTILWLGRNKTFFPFQW